MKEKSQTTRKILGKKTSIELDEAVPNERCERTISDKKYFSQASIGGASTTSKIKPYRQINQQVLDDPVPFIDQLKRDFKIPVFDEIEFTTEVYLDGGSYGKIFKGYWNNIPVAIKQYKPLESANDFKAMRKEMESLSEMNFPGVIFFFFFNFANIHHP